MNTLIATVGLPRSGKTTWAQQQRHYNGWPIVSPDAVRLAIHGQRYLASAEPHVWATIKTMVPALFIAGHEIVLLDATNGTRNQRIQWNNRNWRTLFHFFDVPIEECKRRAIDTGQEDLLSVIDTMADRWDHLGPDELVY